MSEKEYQNPFIDYLISLKENRGSLAALRRGLGQPPGAAPEMFPHVVPWLPANCSEWMERTFFLIASLFALHPASVDSGNMGAHLRATIKASDNELATERRFIALLQSHPDDLAAHLRHSISYLKSKEQPVNWYQLFDDVLHWDHPQRYVQKNWARMFWTRRNADQET